MFESNEIIEKLPKHLMDLVIDQPYNSYTPQDHAVWRYVMRRNVAYLSNVAHKSYMDGLAMTGVEIDRIPEMYGMNRILKKIGWAAVTVDGFIPPSAFMEFQAYKVLVIAADIRPIDQIEYTPAPDIIHEAAGHAPIIADEDYSEYLRLFGEIGSKAFSSKEDYALYEAIRHLSILKADPYTKPEEIQAAEQELALREQNMGIPSEMALIRNLHWWTVEYGLIGDLDNPKIYGAGLLSSIGESYSCLQPEVKKLPYTLAAKDYSFDITTRQPQLFVTPDFQTLTDVLHEFADTMALRKGGLKGIQKAIDSGNFGTCVYDSGLQVSGIFSDVILHDGKPAYLKTSGPTQLAYKDRELPGHSKAYHEHGFGSPVGHLKAGGNPLHTHSDDDLKSLGIELLKEVTLEFDSGVLVQGVLKSVTRKEGQIVLMTFHECRVMYQGELLFDPSWGVYDMAVGEGIVSAFSGLADPDAFLMSYPVPNEKTHKIVHDESAAMLHALYQRLRDMREGEVNEDMLLSVMNDIRMKYPADWLLPLEIFELAAKAGMSGLADSARSYLNQLAEQNATSAALIASGLELIK